MGNEYTFKTIGADGRLEISGAGRGLAWLPRDQKDDVPCVVRVLSRGCLYVTTKARWAEGEGLSEEEAAKSFEASGYIKSEPPEISSTMIAWAKRKKGQDPEGRGSQTYRIALPAVALWSLLRQGEGPLNTKFAKKSCQVLVRSEEDGIYVYSHLGIGWSKPEQP